ncbi:MAG: EAL domain-containing protein [Deferribacterales bacterium]
MELINSAGKSDFFDNLVNKGSAVFFCLRTESGYPVTYLSANAEDILGYSKEDVGTLKFKDLLTKDSRTAMIDLLDDALYSKKTSASSPRFKAKRKDGKEITLSVSLVFSSDDNGSPAVCGYMNLVCDFCESDARLDTLLSTLSNGIVEMDRDCVISYASPSAEQIYGYRSEQMTGKSLAMLMDEHSGQFVIDNFKKAASTEALPTRFTHRHVRYDGTPIFIEMSWAYKRDKNGQIVGFICSMTDVTDKKQANDKLLGQLAFLNNIIESVAHPFFVIDIQTMDVVVSNSAAGHVKGVKCYELLHHSKLPCYMENYDCPFHQVKNNKVSVVTEHVHYDKDNNRLFYEIHGHPVFDEKGNVVQMIEYTLDITDRKKAQSELEKYKNHLELLVEKRTNELYNTNIQLVKEIEDKIEKERQLILAASVLENTVEGITITDQNGVIQKVNPAFTSITGYTAAEAIGKTPRILKSDKHDDAFYEKMWSKLLTKGGWSGEIWNRRKNGDAYPEWLSINSIKDSYGKITHFVAIFHDISEVKQGEEKLKYQAHHDTLTGLPNRQLFNDRLEMALAFAKRHRQKVAVLFIDLDNFKNVNDTMGHYTGDILLQRVAEILKECVRLEDTVARLGGDEFMIILQDIESENNAVETARRILSEFAHPINIHENDFFINASIGITIYPDDGDDVLTIVKNADLAMYRVKETGKNSYQLFTKTMNDKVQNRVNMERELRKSINDNEFEVYYQPKVSLLTGKITGSEALIRWNKNGTMISPMEFIPVAEDTGHIISIGKWVLRKACEDTVRLHRGGFPHLTVAVNLSARQFRDETLIDSVCDILKETGLPPHNLELEITENTVMEDIQTTIIYLAKLVEKGVRISIDDFGTGYSSLSYLKKFPISILKIDRSFIKDIPDDTDDIVISESIISLAKSLNLMVVAEGTETEEQIDFCRDKGCDEVQGYYFSKPVRIEEYADMLANGKTL